MFQKLVIGYHGAILAVSYHSEVGLLVDTLLACNQEAFSVHFSKKNIRQFLILLQFFPKILNKSKIFPEFSNNYFKP